MKLSTKLTLSYFAVAFLVLLVGASSYILNKHINDELIEKSQHSIKEIQRISYLEFHLQNSLLFTRNFLFEKSQEQAGDPSVLQLNSKSAERAVREHLYRFSEKLDTIRTDIHEDYRPDDNLRLNYEQLGRFADTLTSGFDIYRSLIDELFELEDEVRMGNEMFNLTIEPYFRETLLPLLDEFRNNQAESVEIQMASLRTQTERNTRIIITITVIVFILASWLAYFIYRSIARPLNYLTLATDEIGAGNLDKRIRIGTNDELEKLGESFNNMAENLNKSMVSREYVKIIIESMGDMLMVTNPEFEIELINKTVSDTLGYEADELIGKQICSLISNQFLSYLKQSLAESKKARSFEAVLNTKDGREIPVIISYSYLSELNSDYRGIVFVASNITVQKEAEQKVSRSLKEKEVLLAEIHHRVKNNMAVISGILEMQVWHLSEDNATIGPLKESQLRIQSIALVHELLYQSQNFSEINLDEYIEKLLKTIQKMNNNGEKKIELITDLEPVRLTINKAIPASLLLNELVVNAYKHAFQSLSKGKIEVILSQVDSRVELIIQDNGIGLPPGFQPFRQKTLGMTLIKTLAQQINAKLNVESFDEPASGARFVIAFEHG